MCRGQSFNTTNDVRAMFESLLHCFGIVFGFSVALRPPVTLQHCSAASWEVPVPAAETVRHDADGVETPRRGVDTTVHWRSQALNRRICLCAQGNKEIK